LYTAGHQPLQETPILKVEGASMPEVAYWVDGNVAALSFANPPVNGLSYIVGVAIAAWLERARNNPTVRAVVLTGAC
jgi:enoyl-CoA hydratase/carnithine racemase